MHTTRLLSLLSDAINKQPEKKRKIIIVGGGWSGLCAALEASKDPKNEVHLYEADPSRLGGKVSGDVSNPKHPNTHAIRLISEYYPVFFEVLNSIPTLENPNNTLLTRLSPVEDFYFRTSGRDGQIRRMPRQQDQKKHSAIALLKAAGDNGVGKTQILKTLFAVMTFQHKSKEEKEEMQHIPIKEYLKNQGLNNKTVDFLMNFMGITVAAKESSSALMGMDLLSKMFLGIERVEAIRQHRYLNDRNWIIDGPMQERLIPSFTAHLENQGVHIHLGQRLVSIEQQEEPEQQTTAIFQDTDQNLIEVNGDAFVLGLNIKTLERLGFGRKDSNGNTQSLDTEWSSGMIAPLEEIPEFYSTLNHRSAIATIDSPWGIVSMIMSHKSDNGMWDDAVEFPEKTVGFLEVVISQFNNKGSNGKTFLECTPQEAKEEILRQIGFTNESEIQALSEKLELGDNLSYVDQNEVSEWLSQEAKIGPTNEDGKCWVLKAPIYPASAQTPPLDIDTHIPNVFIIGEACKHEGQQIQTPTLELVTENAQEAIRRVRKHLRSNQRVTTVIPPARRRNTKNTNTTTPPPPQESHATMTPTRNRNAKKRTLQRSISM